MNVRIHLLIFACVCLAHNATKGAEIAVELGAEAVAEVGGETAASVGANLAADAGLPGVEIAAQDLSTVSAASVEKLKDAGVDLATDALSRAYLPVVQELGALANQASTPEIIWISDTTIESGYTYAVVEYGNVAANAFSALADQSTLTAETVAFTQLPSMAVLITPAEEAAADDLAIEVTASVAESEASTVTAEATEATLFEEGLLLTYGVASSLAFGSLITALVVTYKSKANAEGTNQSQSSSAGGSNSGTTTGTNSGGTSSTTIPNYGCPLINYYVQKYPITSYQNAIYTADPIFSKIYNAYNIMMQACTNATDAVSTACRNLIDFQFLAIGQIADTVQTYIYKKQGCTLPWIEGIMFNQLATPCNQLPLTSQTCSTACPFSGTTWTQDMSITCLNCVYAQVKAAFNDQFGTFTASSTASTGSDNVFFTSLTKELSTTCNTLSGNNQTACNSWISDHLLQTAQIQNRLQLLLQVTQSPAGIWHLVGGILQPPASPNGVGCQSYCMPGSSNFNIFTCLLLGYNIASMDYVIIPTIQNAQTLLKALTPSTIPQDFNNQWLTAKTLTYLIGSQSISTTSTATPMSEQHLQSVTIGSSTTNAYQELQNLLNTATTYYTMLKAPQKFWSGVYTTLAISCAPANDPIKCSTQLFAAGIQALSQKSSTATKTSEQTISLNIMSTMDKHFTVPKGVKSCYLGAGTINDHTVHVCGGLPACANYQPATNVHKQCSLYALSSKLPKGATSLGTLPVTVTKGKTPESLVGVNLAQMHLNAQAQKLYPATKKT